MKAVTWHGRRDVRVDSTPDPVIEEPTDAIVRITSTAICGSDLHLYEVLGMFIDEGDILGHEPMGIVEEVGSEVDHITAGDRVVIPFNISCGHCWMCERELFAQCETTQNRDAGQGRLAVRLHASCTARCRAARPSTCGSRRRSSGRSRCPRAARRALPLPLRRPADRLAGGRVRGVPTGGTVAVFGLGPIGQMSARIARHQGAERSSASTSSPERLEMARAPRRRDHRPDGTTTSPQQLRELTDGRGPDRVIDAVGMEAHGAPSARRMQKPTAACCPTRSPRS